MKFRIRFHHYINVRKTPIVSGYRANWTALSKPDQNGAPLYFDDINKIIPGDIHNCIIKPICSELWSLIRQDDVLKCMEGSREVGEAIVLEIIPDVPVV